jgi:acyl-coenzyme A thioesterase PaaI-like protein
MATRRTFDSTRLAAELLDPVPANGTFGVEVLHAASASAEVCMLVPQSFTNAIGTVHSSGLIALVEATGAAAIVAAATDADQLEGITQSGSVARIEFLAPAHGLLIGRCILEVEDLAAIESLFTGREMSGQLMTSVDVFDSSEQLVCRGSFIWTIRRLLA